MPRRGVAHVRGGIGELAGTLVDAIRAAGGRVLFRQRVTSVERAAERDIASHTQRGGEFAAETRFVQPAAVGRGPADGGRRARAAAPRRGGRRTAGARSWSMWGWTGRRSPPARPLHHQVLRPRALRRGQQRVPVAEPARGPGRGAGGPPCPHDQHAYRLAAVVGLVRARPARRTKRGRPSTWSACLAAAEIALPGLRSAARLVLPGTPVTFQRYTGRSLGWVGGFPQTSLFRAWAPGSGRPLAGRRQHLSRPVDPGHRTRWDARRARP